jgi:hypothetical protein
VIFLTLVLVCLGFLLPRYLQRRAAVGTADLLRPLLASDARFIKVTVSPTTTGRSRLDGSVASDADAAALRQLVSQAHPPQKPVFAVRVLMPSTK